MKFKDVTYGEERLVDIEVRRSNTVGEDLARVTIRQRICDDYLDWCERMGYPKPFRYKLFGKAVIECKDGDFAQPVGFRLTRKEAFRMALCLLRFALFNTFDGEIRRWKD